MSEEKKCSWLILGCANDVPCLDIFIPMVKEMYGHDCHLYIGEDKYSPIGKDYGLPVLQHEYSAGAEPRHESIVNCLRQMQAETGTRYVGKMDCDGVHLGREWIDNCFEMDVGSFGCAQKFPFWCFYGMCYGLRYDFLERINEKEYFTRDGVMYHCEDVLLSTKLHNMGAEHPYLVRNSPHEHIFIGLAGMVKQNLTLEDIGKYFQLIHCGELPKDGNARTSVASYMQQLLEIRKNSA